MYAVRSEKMAWEACRQLTPGEVGALAEDLATEMLVRRGCRIVARNQVLAEGELDIVAVIDRNRTAVEVRSIRSAPTHMTSPLISPLAPHPLDAFDAAKARQVRKLANAAGCHRVDLVAVRFQPSGVDLHWIPEVA